MSRCRFLPFWLAPALLGASLLGTVMAQQPPQAPLPPDEDAKPAQTKPAPQAKPANPDTDLPPDEDAAANAPEKFSFNPVKSKKALSTGDFYLKKGNFKAAADRFREATQWNENNADAWLKLGEAEEKRDQVKPARDAYQKYLQLAGNTKSAAEVKKKLERLK
jgi:tetratricopeptide (TPR) repeat protein